MNYNELQWITMKINGYTINWINLRQNKLKKLLLYMHK